VKLFAYCVVLIGNGRTVTAFGVLQAASASRAHDRAAINGMGEAPGLQVVSVRIREVTQKVTR
jgi:hypothetical protein